SVGLTLEQGRRRWRNLRRWQQSGEARLWVADHLGQWNHDDWLNLLRSLERSRYWPMDPWAVGDVLEEVRGEWRNLHRWRNSGEARGWVEARQGRWEHADWLALLDDLQQSEFWPLDMASAEQVLRTMTAEYCNLSRWQRSGQPWLWVEARQ